MWEISARSTGMNSRNTTKMVEHKLILFAAVRTLWTLVTLLIKLFRILLKWKYIQDQNYTILAAIWLKRSYFVENVSSRSPGWSVHMGKFSSVPVTEISVAKTEISVTGPARPLIWTHRYFYKEKSSEAGSRKPSQPGWPGSYEEALNLSYFTTATHSEKALLQKFIQPTLDLVEEAWHGEVTSTKRNRG